MSTEENSLKTLQKLFREEPSIRASIAYLSALSGQKEVIVDILNLCFDPDFRVRAAAGISLCLLANIYNIKNYIEIIETLAEDEYWYVREAIAISLGRFEESDQHVTQILEKFLSDENLLVKEAARLSLSNYEISNSLLINSLREKWIIKYKSCQLEKCLSWINNETLIQRLNKPTNTEEERVFKKLKAIYDSLNFFEHPSID